MRHIIGLVACSLATALGVLAIRVLDPAPVPAPPAEVRAYSVAVRQMTLDRAKRLAHATAEVTWLGASPPPPSVEAHVVFFVPSRSAVLACRPITMEWPSSGVETAVVRFDAPADWVGRSEDPGSGYYARVSAVTPDAAAPSERFDMRLPDLVEVLVVEPRATR